MLGLEDVAVLYPVHDVVDHNAGNISPGPAAPQGTGRIGMLQQPMPLIKLIEVAAKGFRQNVLPFIGDPNRPVRRVALGCGAAGGFLEQVIAQNADVFLVGEAKFHQYLEASANDVALILPGHYASERFAVEQLADVIAHRFLDLDESPVVWPSRLESDPQRFFVAKNNST